MGQAQGTLFQLDCNKPVRIEARPERLGCALARACRLAVGSVRLRVAKLGGPTRSRPDAASVRGVSAHAGLECARGSCAIAQRWEAQNDVSLLKGQPASWLAVRRRSAPRAPGGPTLRTDCARSRPFQDHERARDRGDPERPRSHPLRDGGAVLDTGRSEVTLDLDSLLYEAHGQQSGSGPLPDALLSPAGGERA